MTAPHGGLERACGRNWRLGDPWYASGVLAGFDLIPMCDDTAAMTDPADYPPALRRDVDAVNFRRTAMGREREAVAVRCDEQTAAVASRAAQNLRLWRGSQGHTRPWSMRDCGFVVNVA